MDYLREYQKWLASPALTPEEKKELLGLVGKDKQIEDRFYAPLEFGTGGLRGTMGPGLHRMNAHTVRHTTQALANLVKSEGEAAMRAGVAVCCDCRHRSDEFAREAAQVLAGNGIHVKLFAEMRPTPELSFAVREYGCTAGVNITASHNPKEYNGYKVYWSDGAQLPPQHADVVSAEMEKIDIFTGVQSLPYEEALEQGLITLLGAETDKLFLDMALCQSVDQAAVAAVADTFKVVFTPFHGAGRLLVPEALKRLGLRHVLPVEAQMVPDGSFPTVKSPNPEEKAGFKLAIELARQNDVDLIIGTDPDADRVGIIVRDAAGEYVPLTGNQTGVLLLDYLIRARRARKSLPKNAAAIKTIVTTEMARRVAEQNGVACFDTFTGFKFIAEKIKQFEDSGSHKYILGFEESYGYLAGDHARDKDAVTAAMLIAEMACWYAGRNLTLYAAMEELYKTYGYFGERTLNLTMPGLQGLEKMRALMEKLRNDPPNSISGTPVLAVRDYLRGERIEPKTLKIERMELKGSNVLCYELQDGTRFVVRPSGTEPKVKVYVLASGKDRADVDYKIDVYGHYAEGLKEF
jgi:phosphoglucomutase